MSIEDRMSPVSGYTGIFKQPIQNTAKYGPTVFCISDPGMDELCLIPLVPGFYQDVYKLASQVSHPKITIFIPSIDILFISDLFNLVMDLRRVKQSIQWVFPQSPTIESAYQFNDLHISEESYIHPVDGNITITYLEDAYLNDDVYDIIVRDGSKTIYLTSYMTEDKAKALYEDSSYDEIHVPFSSTLYGGLNYKEIVKLNVNYRSKFIINCFTSIDEYEVYGGKDTLPYRQGRMCYNDIVS